jgi:hypothetical protein
MSEDRNRRCLRNFCFTSIALKHPLGRRERGAVATTIRGGRFEPSPHPAKIGAGMGQRCADCCALNTRLFSRL